VLKLKRGVNMQSLKELYKIGRGPSSSHTMGPEKAIGIIKEKYKEADEAKVILYGSLSLTGKGHGTDKVIIETFAPVKCEVVFDNITKCEYHPNTMDVILKKDNKIIGEERVYSVGGGSIEFEGELSISEPSCTVYDLKFFSDISKYCKAEDKRIWEYVVEREGKDILDYLSDIWEQMKKSVHEGLTCFGVLPGQLKTQRRAQILYNQRHIDESAQTRENRLVSAYAFAVSEQNASGGIIVTAPTCGACGVVPSVLKYMQESRGFTDLDIVKALATGGLIGNIIKTNASISGAECGCQAEIGSACSMAAAALAELFGMGIDQIEYAAEVAMEHHLGLTCDPIAGLVQIPCIERNAVAAMRAINALSLSNFLADSRKISFDVVVETMYNTGRDLHYGYRETSHSGLAKFYDNGSSL
jgi:L-serine dehydratase